MRSADADFEAEAALRRLVGALPPDLAARYGLDLLLVAAGRASHGDLRAAAARLGVTSAWQQRIDALYAPGEWS